MKNLLAETATRSARYLESVGSRRVAPRLDDIARLEALGGPLPQTPTDRAEILALLDDIGSPATVASSGGRYFGFVTGGTLPSALAANWLAGAWDQNVAFAVMSPVAAKIEEIVLAWTADLLGLPATCGVGFVTGTTTANFSALAAARTALLKRKGWVVWRSAHQGGGGRGGSRLVAEGTCHAGAWSFARRLGAHRQPRADESRGTAPTRQPNSGLHSSWQREHWRGRSCQGDLFASPGGGSMGPCGCCFRNVGGGLPTLRATAGRR